MKKRIWELDAFRGLCILGMLVVHFVYDVVVLYGLVDWHLPKAFLLVQQWGGVLFLLISGISVTLGSRSVKRGLIVFLCGVLCTLVTAGMYWLGFAENSIIIYFGVLHCLGMCMLLWSAVKKLPVWALAALGIALIAAGFWADSIQVDFPWLVLLNITYPGFSTIDYFPLLPNFGFFLLGAVIGKTVYRGKESLLPGINANHPALFFLQLCGKHSLWIYLLHQPILCGIFTLLSLFS